MGGSGTSHWLITTAEATPGLSRSRERHGRVWAVAGRAGVGVPAQVQDELQVGVLSSCSGGGDGGCSRSTRRSCRNGSAAGTDRPLVPPPHFVCVQRVQAAGQGGEGSRDHAAGGLGVGMASRRALAGQVGR